MTGAEELATTAPAERTLHTKDLGNAVLLAIDTALGSSVALGIGDRIFEVSHDDPRGHAEAIGTLIERVLEHSGTPASAVTGVVSGMGPGPFTGLRVGIAAAHAFAVGRSVPIHPLQSHEAVAFAVGSDDPVRIMQDAKRRELFVTGYAGLDSDGIPVRISGPELQLRAEFVAGDADVWPERIPAARLVELAALRLRAGRPFETDRALYLRAPDVQPPKPGMLGAGAAR